MKTPAAEGGPEYPFAGERVMRSINAFVSALLTLTIGFRHHTCQHIQPFLAVLVLSDGRSGLYILW